MLMETKITLGQTPTHLSPTHSTPPGTGSRIISHISTAPPSSEWGGGGAQRRSPPQASQRETEAEKASLSETIFLGVRV